jgi:hypothetical protein
MATVTKDFRVKHGLVVEGTNATVNASDIITEDAITGGTQTNITVTYNPTTKVVDFVAESGLADGDTDDLAEGTTNLYFTDQRALDATASAYDLAGAAAQALADAEDYADGLAANYDAAGSAATAESNANSYTDGEITTALSTAQGYADDAESSANSYTDGEVETALTTSQGYVDTHSDLTTGVHGVSGDVVGTSDAQTLTNKTMGDDLLMNGNQISGLAAPTQADHAATKSYVDAVSEGLHVHEQVHAIATTPLATITGGTVTYNNGTSGVGATLTLSTALDLAGGDLDGDEDIVITDRVLITGEANTAHNGVYVITSTTVLTRASDFDTPTEMAGGDFIFVTHGTNYADTGWVLSEPVTAVGTDAVIFIQFSGAGTYLAGNGLNLDGNTFEIDDTITANLSGTQTLTNKTIDGSDNTLSNIPNSALDNDSITVNGTATALGESVTLGTDDVAEGSTNLYFTNTRAVDALEAVVPNFTAVEVNSIAKQVAAIVGVEVAAQTVAYAFPKADYRSAKFLVKVSYGNHTEVSEVLLTLDFSDNIAITEFAVVSTNGSASAISAGINGSNVELLVTPTNAASTITVFGTLISSEAALFA